MRSPGLEQKGFAAELPTMKETREEHGQAQGGAQQKYAYNPQDYAGLQKNYQNPPYPTESGPPAGGYQTYQGQR
jgi:hypothetical protein